MQRTFQFINIECLSLIFYSLGHNFRNNYFCYAGEARYLEAYHHYTKSKESLDLRSLKFLFLGPSQFGKTTAMCRLMGEMVDLQTAGEA